MIKNLSLCVHEPVSSAVLTDVHLGLTTTYFVLVCVIWPRRIALYCLKVEDGSDWSSGDYCSSEIVQPFMYGVIEEIFRRSVMLSKV